MAEQAYNANGRRRLCEFHVKQLAKKLGLLVGTFHFGELLHRVAHVAKSSRTMDYEVFQRDIAQKEPTSEWFRHVPGQSLPAQKNVIYPYRFAQFGSMDPSQLLENFQGNADAILRDILSWYDPADQTNLQAKGGNYIDLPKIFNWIFNQQYGDKSVAEMVASEARLHQHQLCSSERVEYSNSPLVPTEQFNLGQQLLEQHPLIYLLYLLLNPSAEKTLFLVSYPTPILHSTNHQSESFTFSGDPTEERGSHWIRAITPVLFEGADASDQILTGITEADQLARFMSLYEEAAIALGANTDIMDSRVLNRRVVNHVVGSSQGEFGIIQDPIPPGCVRFFMQHAATCAGSGDRLLLQPQLVPLYLANPEIIKEARNKAQPLEISAFGARLGKETRRNPLADTFPSPSALSEAIQLRRPFQDPFVLSEVATLLSGDRQKILSYISGWQESAVRAYSLRLRSYREAEALTYREKSITQADPTIESDIEMVPASPLSDGSLPRT